MSYTDEEILDLEDSLDSVGHSVQVRLGLVEPDYWNQQEMGVFRSEEHTSELQSH